MFFVKRVNPHACCIRPVCLATLRQDAVRLLCKCKGVHFPHDVNSVSAQRIMNALARRSSAAGRPQVLKLADDFELLVTVFHDHSQRIY